MPLYKLVASQAKCIYSYKNAREKVQSCCASIYFNRQCLKLGVKISDNKCCADVKNIDLFICHSTS